MGGSRSFSRRRFIIYLLFLYLLSFILFIFLLARKKSTTHTEEIARNCVKVAAPRGAPRWSRRWQCCRVLVVAAAEAVNWRREPRVGAGQAISGGGTLEPWSG